MTTWIQLRKLLAAHHVTECQLSRRQSSLDFPSRIRSDLSNSQAAPEIPGPAPLTHSESLPSIEPLKESITSPARLPKTRSVSFIDAESKDSTSQIAKPQVQELSDQSVVSRYFDMHQAWRRLGEEQVSKMTRCQSSLPSESFKPKVRNVAKHPSMAQLWAVSAMLNLFLLSISLPMVAFVPPGIHWVDAISVVTASWHTRGHKLYVGYSQNSGTTAPCPVF